MYIEQGGPSGVGGHSQAEKNNQGNPKPSPDKDICEKHRSAAYLLTQQEILKLLVAPATAKFPKTPSRLYYQGDCWFEIESSFDSENRFGALLRTEFTAKLLYRLEHMDWYVEHLTIMHYDDETSVLK